MRKYYFISVSEWSEIVKNDVDTVNLFHDDFVSIYNILYIEKYSIFFNENLKFNKNSVNSIFGISRILYSECKI